MGSDNSIPNTNHEITTIENLLHDLKIFNWAVNNKKIRTELDLNLKITLVSNVSNFFHKHLWRFVKKSVKFAMFNKIEGKDKFIRSLSLNEFYEFYDMIENYDVLLTGKSWDTINVNDVMSVLKESIKENEQEKGLSLEKKISNTPDEDNICVICFDKRIKLILKDCFHGFCEECCQKWIIDKSKSECPLCRAMVANTRSKLYKQAIVKQDNQDMKVLLKESILNFIIKP